MNKVEVGQLLTLASGFDRREVDRVTVEAWFLVLEGYDYETCKAGVVAHQTGPDKDQYMKVGHITEYSDFVNRKTASQIRTDVISARARGLVGTDWPVNRELPEAAKSKLSDARAAAKAEEERYAEEASTALTARLVEMPDMKSPNSVDPIDKEDY